MTRVHPLLIPLFAACLWACGSGGTSATTPDAGGSTEDATADGIGAFDADASGGDNDTGTSDARTDGSPSDADTGTTPDADASTDADTDEQPDADNDADNDSGDTDDAGDADSETLPEPPPNPVSVTSGGSVVSSAGHRARILVGGTSPASRISSSSHRGFLAIGTPLFSSAPGGGE